jgi:hypothetical protein
VATYPHLPLFANYLGSAYLHVGDVEKAETLLRETSRRHPHYLFAKINYAQLCLDKGDIAKIPSIFDHKMDLKQLYPHRKRFHIAEFTGFTVVMCRYYHAIEERDAAVSFYRILKQIAPRHPMTKQAKHALYPPFWVHLRRKWAGRRAEKADKTERSDNT